MNSTLPGLSPQQLRRAADIKEKIESLQNDLNRIVGAANAGSDGAGPRKRRKMSAAARKKIAAAARARWARARAKKKK